MHALQATKIGVHDLRRALQGLAMVKGKALLKKSPPGGKEIATGDAFCVNDKFDSKLFKIKFAAAGAQKEVRPRPTRAFHSLCRCAVSYVCPGVGV